MTNFNTFLSLPAATPAKLTALPAEARSRACMTSLSDLASSTWLRRFARSLFSGRILQHDQMHLGLGGGSPTVFDHLAIVRSRLRSGHVVLAATTNGKGCLCSEYLPTLRKNSAKNNAGDLPPSGYKSYLEQALGLLPTLMKSDSTRTTPQKRGESNPTLAFLARKGLLPTLAGHSDVGGVKGFDGGSGARKKVQDLGLTGPLAPSWCETFMGFPLGWTLIQPTEPSE